jgi:hypothetical protein
VTTVFHSHPRRDRCAHGDRSPHDLLVTCPRLVYEPLARSFFFFPLFAHCAHLFFFIQGV